MHIEEILIKLNACFFDKKWKFVEKYNEICEKVRNSIKKIE